MSTRLAGGFGPATREAVVRAQLALVQVVEVLRSRLLGVAEGVNGILGRFPFAGPRLFDDRLERRVLGVRAFPLGRRCSRRLAFLSSHEASRRHGGGKRDDEFAILTRDLRRSAATRGSFEQLANKAAGTRKAARGWKAKWTGASKSSPLASVLIRADDLASGAGRQGLPRELVDVRTGEADAPVAHHHVAAAGMLGVHLAQLAEPGIGRVDQGRVLPGIRAAMHEHLGRRHVAGGERESRGRAADRAGDDTDPRLVAQDGAVLAQEDRVGQPVGDRGDAGPRVPVDGAIRQRAPVVDRVAQAS